MKKTRRARRKVQAKVRTTSARSPRKRKPAPGARRVFTAPASMQGVKLVTGRKNESLKKKKEEANLRRMGGKAKRATKSQKGRKKIEYHGPRLKRGVRKGRRSVFGLLPTITAVGQHGAYEGRVIQIHLYRYFQAQGEPAPVTPAEARRRGAELRDRLERQYQGRLKIIRLDVSYLDRKGHAKRKER